MTHDGEDMRPGRADGQCGQGRRSHGRRSRAGTYLAIKTGALAVALAGVGFAAYMHDATQAISDARARVGASLDIEDVERASAMRDTAVANLRGAWSQPGRWHAEAQEITGWAHLITAQSEQNRMNAALSYIWTGDAVQSAPVHPRGWLRLASLDQFAGERVCKVTQCLDNTWLTAPMGIASQPFACERMQMAIANGMVTSITDLKARLFMYEFQAEFRIDRCLTGLPEEELTRLKDRIGDPREWRSRGRNVDELEDVLTQ